MSTDDRARLLAQQIAIAKALTRIDGPNPTDADPFLADLDTGEIARSAETLIRKRISQTRSALRWSSQLMGETFSKEFRVFASTHLFHGSDAIYRDAIEFARWLATRHPNPPWLQDSLRWECERCIWESNRFYFVCFRMRYLIGASMDGEGSWEPVRFDHRVWMWRLGRKGGIHVFPRGKANARNANHP
jgi:hypothetical protein